LSLAVTGYSTRPIDSWPRTSRVLPGGAHPYFPSTISTSVPQTPTAMVSTSTEPSRLSGSGTSSKLAVAAFLGSTVIAFIQSPPPSVSLLGDVADMSRALFLCRDLQQLVDVAPRELLKDIRRRRALQERKRFAGHAFAAHARRRGVVVLADAAAVAVAAAAVAAEEQLVLVARQEVRGELRIA